MPTWSVGSRDLCQPRTEADGKPVTESNLSLRAPAQRAADLSRLRLAYSPGACSTDRRFGERLGGVSHLLMC